MANWAGMTPYAAGMPKGNKTRDADADDTTTDDGIVSEAHDRFKRCSDWESNAQRLFSLDLKFANADPDNHWQWPDAIRTQRDLDNRPVLTINKTRQHNLLIINDGKRNNPGIKIRAVGGQASHRASQIYEGIVRHIEYISNASAAYDTAYKFMVEGGIGYWRVMIDYESDDTFDQQIFIKRIKDPLTVYVDPDIDELDGSDARFGFVFVDVPNDEFKRQYPDYKDIVSTNAAPLRDTIGWFMKDHIRIAEYFRRTETRDTLLTYDDGKGSRVYIRKSKLGPDLYKKLKEDLKAGLREREILDQSVEWFKIAGNKIVDRKPWLGKYIPLVRSVADETLIEGKPERKGHTRNLKDAQRMYNYNSSASVESGALQTKIPFIAPVRAIAGLETYWRTANVQNWSVIPYNDVDSDGKTIQMPQRSNAGSAADVFLKGLEVAQNEMMMASGQWQSQTGQNENAKSGVAINERKQQGDLATYHFVEGRAIAIRYTGKIILDLIPKLYDTKRVIKIMSEDGRESEVTIDPMQAKSLQEQKAQEEGDIGQILFNPKVGKYEVQADTGPGYATRRAHAFDAFTQILAQAPQFIPILGDIYFQNGDFPQADEAAARMRRMIPKEALGEGPTPELTQAQQQIEKLTQTVSGLIQKVADRDIQLRDRGVQSTISAYDAETKRFTGLAKVGNDAGGQLEMLIRATVADMLGLPLQPIVDQVMKAGQLAQEQQSQGGGVNEQLMSQEGLAQNMDATGTAPPSSAGQSQQPQQPGM